MAVMIRFGLRPGIALMIVGVVLCAGSAPAQTPGPGVSSREMAFESSPAIEAAARRIQHLPGGIEAKTDAILRFIFDDPKGLRFQYREAPTLTASQTFEQRAGNCLSLVNLFVAIARSAGLDAYPVEVEDFVSFSRDGETQVRRTHVVGGISVVGKLWTLDFLPHRDKSYRRVKIISDARHTSLFLNALAVEAMLGGDLDSANQLLHRALTLQPKSPETWNNLGVRARRSGDESRAIECLGRALDIDAGFLPALGNLARMLRARGDEKGARSLEDRALRQKYQNPYFLVEQSRLRVADGDLTEAEMLLQRARRIDASLPEIYLALGRIDLIRGDLSHARREFAAARRHSERFSAAFRDGVDRKIASLIRLTENL